VIDSSKLLSGGGDFLDGRGEERTALFIILLGRKERKVKIFAFKKISRRGSSERR